MLVLLLIFSCGQKQTDTQSTTGTTDTIGSKAYQAVVNLPPPDESASEVKFSKVIGWPEGKTPVVPQGLAISKFMSGVKSPRNIYVAPNGDIFVSFANTESEGVSKVTDKVTGRAKSQHMGSSLNQIYLFRDENGDGTPEVQTVYLSGLNQPFGILVLNNYFYVANTDGLFRYPYNESQQKITAKGEKILDLPAGGYNNHWTRNIISNKDGSKIFISVGSASNVAEHGFDEEIRRANILEINPDGSGERIFASGLRNPVGMALLPDTNELWTVVNERDKLGDDLVPDYFTSVKENGFYGWPYSYFGQHLDPRIKEEEQKPELVKKSIVPDLPLDSHSSSIGVVFYDGDQLPSQYRGGAFIAQRGSWNRSAFTGYRIAFVPFKNGKLSGPAENFIDGFIADRDKSEVYGRPVGIAVTKQGNLLISDDASDVIWFVKSAQR